MFKSFKIAIKFFIKIIFSLNMEWIQNLQLIIKNIDYYRFLIMNFKSSFIIINFIDNFLCFWKKDGGKKF